MRHGVSEVNEEGFGLIALDELKHLISEATGDGGHRCFLLDHLFVAQQVNEAVVARRRAEVVVEALVGRQQ